MSRTKPSGKPRYSKEDEEKLAVYDLSRSLDDVDAAVDAPILHKFGEFIEPSYSTKDKAETAIDYSAKTLGYGGFGLWYLGAEANSDFVAGLGFLTMMTGAGIKGIDYFDPEEKWEDAAQSIQDLSQRSTNETYIGEVTKFLDDNYEEDQRVGMKFFEAEDNKPAFDSFESDVVNKKEAAIFISQLETADKFAHRQNVWRKEFDHWIHTSIRDDHETDVTPDKKYGREWVEENMAEETDMSREELFDDLGIPEPRNDPNYSGVELSIISKHPDVEPAKSENVEKQIKEEYEDDFRDWEVTEDVREVENQIKQET